MHPTLKLVRDGSASSALSETGSPPNPANDDAPSSHDLWRELQIENEVRQDLTQAAPRSLAELIAEERRAWNAETSIRRQADEAWYAFRDEFPEHAKIDREREDFDPGQVPEQHRDRLSRINQLYRQAWEMVAEANRLRERILAWRPVDLSEAISLLEFAGSDVVDEAESAPSPIANVLARLRVIGALRPTPQPAANSPAGNDDGMILAHFRAWADIRRRAWKLPDDDDFDAALVPADQHEDAIFGIPARSGLGVAVKLFLWLGNNEIVGVSGDDPISLAFHPTQKAALTSSGSRMLLALVRDISALAPELAPLCAGVLDAAANADDEAEAAQ